MGKGSDRSFFSLVMNNTEGEKKMRVKRSVEKEKRGGRERASGRKIGVV